MHGPDNQATIDMSRGFDIEALLAWIDTYCAAHTASLGKLVGGRVPTRPPCHGPPDGGRPGSCRRYFRRDPAAARPSRARRSASYL